MNALFIGGSTFLGHSLKSQFKRIYLSSHITSIDLPRENYLLFKTSDEEFLDMRDLVKLGNYSKDVDYIFINLYDLLDPSAIHESKQSQNLLLQTLNFCLDLIERQNANVLLLLNKNQYLEPSNSYQNQYNIILDFYLTYFKYLSKVNNEKISIFMLPNLIGKYAPQHSVMQIFKNNIKSNQPSTVTVSKREFVHVNEVVSIILDHLNSVENYIEVKSSSIEIANLFYIVNNKLNGKSNSIVLNKEPYLLNRIPLDPEITKKASSSLNFYK
ncbi:hypothetical protein J2R98_002619 [Alkalibacillus filiformis]|uniref:NAD-dependent epimerase/dehydratase domain-containing protein n=1 Tax=Alkalibacillus filiformis TaxID=200990 RepID=A0ABU0DWU5_9BACI|nr:hypothetical protein [Alkalibacillus filiformis]MDQ0352768.1 hypothetical protein [Alkalibacillus filiformis]